MLKIVIPDDFPSQIKGTRALELIKKYNVKLYNSKASSQEEFIQRMKNAEVVVNVRAYSKFTEEVFKRCSSLKLLSILGTGTDHIDLEDASKHGVLVTNTPGFAAVAVAEHSLTLMVSVARKISLIDREVKEGKWPRGLMTQIYGKTLGLIGLGAIGGQFAKIGNVLGMKVISWETFQPSKERAKEFGVEFVSLEYLLKEADVISIHARLTSQTKNLIGRNEFSLMKPTAIIINTARGAIINREALLDALTSGKIIGAGLDAFDIEPLPPNDPFLKLNNVTLTPHNAGMTQETIERGAQMAVDNIINYLQGSPTNIVNK